MYWLEVYVAERHWLATLITYAPQHLFGLLSVVLILWSVARKQRKLVYLNIAAAVFFGLTLFGFNIPLHAWRSCTGTKVRFMTYNVHHASRNIMSIKKVIDRVQPDIICLQEANPFRQWKQDPTSNLVLLLPGWRIVRYGEVAVFSRYPIISSRLYDLPYRDGRKFLEAVVSVKGKHIRVINVHFSTAAHPHIVMTRRLSSQFYLRRTAQVRSEQANALLRYAGNSNQPLIIAGDFNTPPRGMIYRRLASAHQDVFHAVGWGCGFTFKSGLPVMRIDYIFTGSGVHAVRCAPLRVHASDHRPLVADFIIK